MAREELSGDDRIFCCRCAFRSRSAKYRDQLSKHAGGFGMTWANGPKDRTCLRRQSFSYTKHVQNYDSCPYGVSTK